MSNPREQYFNEAENAVHMWNELKELAAESCFEIPRFKLLFLHTLELALQTDWKRLSSIVHSHLTVTLHQLASTCTNMYVAQQCWVLKKIIEHPWGHAVLQKLSNNQESNLNELTEYFGFENGTVIIRRLETLLLGKCADVAMRLSESCLVVNKETKTLDYSQHELDYILDIYISSLYDVKKNRGLIMEIKTYSLVDGLQLLKRYNSYGVGNQFNERCKHAPVWKHDRKIRKQISSTLLANAIMHENSIDAGVLKDLIGEWISIHAFVSNVEFESIAMKMIRKSVLISRSSKCIYPFCSFLIDRYNHRKFNIDLIARCLIRAINLNMNEIEQHRVRGERQQERLLSTQLAEGFTLISELFAATGCENFRKECLLTAFSLAPSTSFIERLEALVQASTNNQYTEATIPERNVGAGEPDQRNALPTYYSEVEVLPVDDTIKEDLHTILKYRRHYTLSWSLAWSELKMNCTTYVSKSGERDFGLEVPLRYLDLDYDQFKHIPINYDAYIGIEKGYEEFETAELVMKTVKPRRLKRDEEMKELRIVLRCFRELRSSNTWLKVSIENGCDAYFQIKHADGVETSTSKKRKTEDGKDWSVILRYPRKREPLFNSLTLRADVGDDGYTGVKEVVTSVETKVKKAKRKQPRHNDRTSKDWRTVLRPRKTY